jgi:hypothetical protein
MDFLDILESVFSESVKDIKYNGDYVTITHYIREEYDLKDFCSGYTFNDYKKDMINAYKISENIGWCWNIDITDEYIKHDMKYYDKILINHKNYFSCDILATKIINLLKTLKDNNIFHDDIAFRNIAIDKDDNLQLIDLSSVQSHNWINNIHNVTYYIDFLGYLYSDLKNNKMSDVYDEIIKWLHSLTNL